MPRPLSGCQIKAEIKGFLLMYHLFLYKQWFFHNIEKGWRKIFEKDYFRDFLKMMKFQKKKSSSLFQFSEETIASTKTNDTSAESPGFQLLFDILKEGVACSGGATPSRHEKHILLNFMAAEWVFDFLPSLRSLGHNF